DLAAMDRAVKPGDDFFRYVNGAWLEHTEIPADRSSLTSFSALDELAKTRERAIIDDVAAHGGDGDQRKVADTYPAFMDEEALEKKGLAPIQPELDAIAALPDKPALARALGRTLRADVDLLNATVWHTDRLFGLWVSQHLQKPESAPYLVQGGLSLP